MAHTGTSRGLQRFSGCIQIVPRSPRELWNPLPPVPSWRTVAHCDLGSLKGGFWVEGLRGPWCFSQVPAWRRHNEEIRERPQKWSKNEPLWKIPFVFQLLSHFVPVCTKTLATVAVLGPHTHTRTHARTHARTHVHHRHAPRLVPPWATGEQKTVVRHGG